MRKSVMTFGIVVFILAGLGFVLAGTTLGGTSFISRSTQLYYMIAAGFGLLVAIIGAIIKNKKPDFENPTK
jgi:uncharacterized Tic20 family protein